MQTIEEALEKLNRSSFRRGFCLSDTDIRYVREKGMDEIRRHAENFVKTRLSSAYPEKDGKQTPMRGHPVFIAQHATACCCRGCLNKWYHVKKGVPLSEEQQKKIVNLLMAWIEKEVQK